MHNGSTYIKFAVLICKQALNRCEDRECAVRDAPAIGGRIISCELLTAVVIR